jgi:integron integrase
MRLNHYSIRTEQSYLEIVKRFLLYTGPVTEATLEASHVKRFLEHLALERQVAASTQNQAFSAILFFFKRVLDRDMGDLSDTLRAKRGRQLPVVLSREQIGRFLAMTEGTSGLMLRLIYGTGFRLMECIRLRTKEVDFQRGTLLVRAGKGNKDRMVMLPESLREPLKQHFERLRVLFDQDRAADVSGVWLPGALTVKSPNAGKEFGWQWVFPAKDLSLDPRSGLTRRHHVHDNTLHKAVKGGCGARGYHSVGERPHAAAFVRDAFVGGGYGYPHGAGVARARERRNNPNLHACDAETGLGREEPAGWAGHHPINHAWKASPRRFGVRRLRARVKQGRHVLARLWRKDGRITRGHTGRARTRCAMRPW